jgi:hypothetical protein
MGQMCCLDPYLIFLIGLSMVEAEHLPATGRTTKGYIQGKRP